jgi:hypothetical protein
VNKRAETEHKDRTSRKHSSFQETSLTQGNDEQCQALHLLRGWKYRHFQNPNDCYSLAVISK